MLGRGRSDVRRQVAVAGAWLVVGACVSVPPGGYPGGGVREPASLVEVAPAAAVNALGERVLLVATARDDGGRPVPGTAIEWVLVAGSAVTIDAVDGGDGRPARAQGAHRAASSVTAALPYELSWDGDDVLIGVGQTWCVVTSAAAGDSDVLVYSPQTPDRLWGEVRARCSWVDAAWEWPLAAVSDTGAPYTFATRVVRARDGAPLAGYVVTYEVRPGVPQAAFGGRAQRLVVVTDVDGVASAELIQRRPETGWNDVDVTIRAPAGEGGAPGRVLATHVARVTWTVPRRRD